MDLSVGNASRALKVYLNQSRIADLNRQSHLRTAQGQMDTVSLSAEAKRLFAESLARPEPQPVLRNIQPAITAAPPFKASVQNTPPAPPATTAAAPVNIQPVAPRNPVTSAKTPDETDLLEYLNFADATETDDADIQKPVPPPFQRGKRRG